MTLAALFHWAPADRRPLIRQDGLRPYKSPTVSSGDVAYPYICLSPTPSRAWSLSGDMDWITEVEDWDLWQVELPTNAEVHVRAFFGREIDELKVYTAIPPDHLWHVGTRTVPYAEPIA